MPGFFPVVVASRRLHIHQFWGTEEGFASVQCFQTFIKRICWQQRKVSIVTEVPFFSSEMQNHLNCSVMVGKKNWHMSALMPWNYIYEFEINGDYRKICKNYRITELQYLEKRWWIEEIVLSHFSSVGVDKIIPFFTNSEGSSFMEGKKIVYGRQKEVRLKCTFRLQKLEMKRKKK